MDIYVATVTSTGATELAAFDACLLEAGVGNLNLIHLSSVIPPNALVRRDPVPQPVGGWGDRLYCVMAEKRTSKMGAEAWAGVGWVQEAMSGKGLFAEAYGDSKGEVETLLEKTLTEMTERRSDTKWDEIDMALAGARCDGPPVCALTIATYCSEPWPVRWTNS